MATTPDTATTEVVVEGTTITNRAAANPEVVVEEEDMEETEAEEGTMAMGVAMAASTPDIKGWR
jgi:hypothetical protein